MARGAPGIVRVQENPSTRTKHLTIPQNLLEDLSLRPRDLIIFYKHPTIGAWIVKKITARDKEIIKTAHRNGENVHHAAEQL